MDVRETARKALGRGRDFIHLISDAIDIFSAGGGTTVGAAVAFYAVLSAAPLATLAVVVAGVVYGEQQARAELIRHISAQAGRDVASVLQRLMEAMEEAAGSGIATVIGIGILLWAASRLFLQLQEGINTIWGVRMRNDAIFRRRIRLLVQKRMLAFAVALGCGVLLALLLAAEAVLSVLQHVLWEIIPFSPFWHLLDLGISFGLLVVLFTALYRTLPDAHIGRRDSWIGAAFTAALCALGLFLIGIYLGNLGVGSMYGAVGSIAVLIIWVYYSSLIFFFGASFTRAWSARYGTGIQPDDYATRVWAEDELVSLPWSAEHSAREDGPAPESEVLQPPDTGSSEPHSGT